MVLGLCRLLLRDPFEAEDAAQQVFLSAHSAVLRGSPPRDAHAWLAAIARNECRSRIHAHMREPLTLPDLPSDLPDPLAVAIRATDLEAIWAAISSLPRRQRRALVLREVGGLSYHELGRALGVSQSSVESLLFRARQQVRALVAAATPLALRDDLARLLPGFDPGSAGLAARAASLPVVVKLATAAVSVGLVTTGAAQFPEHHARPQVKAQGMISRARAGPVPSAILPNIEGPQGASAPTLLVTERKPLVLHTQSAPRQEQDNSDRSRRHELVHARRAGPQEQEHVQPRREPADVRPGQVEAAQAAASHDEGSGGFGSGDSGSSSGDSQPAGSND
jgi:RNA polymerase sigma-70 factor (ECF subfamily)